MINKERIHRRGLASTSLRQKIVIFVGGLVILSLLASTLSLYRITEVNHSLETMNRVSIPLGRSLAQLQSDSEVFQREIDRRLGRAHWAESHWRPRAIPSWVTEVIQAQMERMGELSNQVQPGISSEAFSRWRQWLGRLSESYRAILVSSQEVQKHLERGEKDEAQAQFVRLSALLEDWNRQIHWGTSEYERSIRVIFEHAQGRVSALKTGLETILVLVITLSLLLLWFGERALRPLNEITLLAREIARRGLRKEDKHRLPVALSLVRDDEVGQLTREFHSMATALLEREKTVEETKVRELALQERLHHAEQMAAVGRLSAQVAHEVRNPLHSIGLEAEMALELVTSGKTDRQPLAPILNSILQGVERLEKITENYLRLSRISSGERERADLSEVVEEVLATYALEFQKNQIEVEWGRAAGQESAPLILDCDRSMLEQALGNLVRNAIQAVQEQSALVGESVRQKIELKMGHAESGRIWLQIKDSGPGISASVQLKLFTPFVTSKAQGTGLGLSFVKQVMEDHHGYVRHVPHESEADQGACFELMWQAQSTPSEVSS